jgi:hypothetical protein
LLPALRLWITMIEGETEQAGGHQETARAEQGGRMNDIKRESDKAKSKVVWRLWRGRLREQARVMDDFLHLEREIQQRETGHERRTSGS